MKYNICNYKYFEKLPLDNAGKIYPAGATKKWNSVFGVSATLNESVNQFVLQQAVIDLAVRFPSMYVKLKKKFFWDTFIPAIDFNIVEKEQNSPCRPFRLSKGNKPLFRVVYSENEIRAEFFHALTDGSGALEYLKALILRYFQIKSSKDFKCSGIKNYNEDVKNYELNDDFQTIYKKGEGITRKDTNAYQIKFDTKSNYLNAKKYYIDVNSLKAIAKSKYDCTVTQYIATAYALALLSQYDKTNNKPIKLSIPVNLRNYFGSKTLRNFSSYITINVTPATEYTFEAVLELIKNGMKEKITKENLFKAVCQNVADEKMIIAKYSPNIIKRLVMRQAFRMYGERKYTSTVSSLGYIELGSELTSKVESFSVMLGETYINKINCAVVGYQDKICVTITTPSESNAIQNEFESIISNVAMQTKKAKKTA